MIRHTLLRLVRLLTVPAGTVKAQGPERAVRIVVPFPPGGTTDIVARLVENGAASRLPGGLAVDNRAGAGGNIGTAEVARGLHLALHVPCAIFQELIRATLASWYRDLVTVLPVIRHGMAHALSAPGLGTALLPEVRWRENAAVREAGKPRGA